MTTSVQRLEETGSAMREALRTADWGSIGQLDIQCRQVIEQALADAVDQEVLRERMQDLLQLYRELVSSCQGEKARLGDELVQLSQSQHAAKVYQFFQ